MGNVADKWAIGFDVTIPLPAKPKARPVVTRNGTYMPPEYTQWRVDAGTLLKAAARKARAKFEGPVEIEVEFHKDSFTLHIEERLDIKRHGRADLDNLIGAVMDLCQDVELIDNDRNVVALGGQFI